MKVEFFAHPNPDTLKDALQDWFDDHQSYKIYSTTFIHDGYGYLVWITYVEIDKEAVLK